MNNKFLGIPLMLVVWAAGSPAVQAADITATVPSGGGFVVQDHTGTQARFSVQDNGVVKVPGLPTATQSDTLLCFGSATGQLGPCPAGHGVTWVDATSDVNAAADTGYLADSASQVTLTLPASPAVGDIVRVTGVGTGGWKIAQNTGQSILTPGIPSGGVWLWTQQTNSSQQTWLSIASSADGSHLAAASGGYIYTSTDYGAHWTQQTGSGPWTSIASSADGSHLAAVAGDGNVHISTDFGVIWQAYPVTGASDLISIASSADGSHLAAADYGSGSGGYIYTSTDSGVSWTQQTNSGQYNFGLYHWQSIASSSDGRYLAATDSFGNIFSSLDYGVSWTLVANSCQECFSIASSSDGSHLAVANYPAYISTSTNYGNSWSTHGGSSGQHDWYAIASSSDGSHLAAVGLGNYIYTSTDSGVSWTQQTNSGQHDWYAIASSSDGSHLAAVDHTNGYIYTGTYSPTYVASTTTGTGGSLSGGQNDAIELQYVGHKTFIVLSYTVPSGSFTIQ